MLSIVIPLGHGSRWQDNELRYCLRGIEENLQFKDIWIIGRIPSWVKNVNFISFSDSENVSDHNIMKKVKVACEHPEITDRFLFANDDHFLLHKFDINNFPNYYDGTCHDLLKNRHQSPYQRRVRNTMNYLIANKLPQYSSIFIIQLFTKRINLLKELYLYRGIRRLLLLSLFTLIMKKRRNTQRIVRVILFHGRKINALVPCQR